MKRQIPIPKATGRLARMLSNDNTLDELRFRRDMAKRDGDLKLALRLAIAIDRKRGLY